MIVGFDATTLRGAISGVGYYTARLMESLANGAGEGVIDRLVVLANREVPVPPAPKLEVYTRRRFAVRSVWMQVLLPGILREVRPDLVHFTNYLAPAVGTVPYVVSIHDMTLALLPECHTLKKRLLTSTLIPHVARGAARILAPSESTRRDVIRLLQVDPGRVRVTPYAASPVFRPDTEGEGNVRRRYGLERPYLLYVGTLEPRKNLARVLAAFARIAPAVPEVDFVLVGQAGWKYQDVLRALAQPALLGRVRALGYVPEVDLPLLYSHALGLVYASLYEGFGLPVVEAMACGAPVLTSRGSSLEEVAGGAALLVDPTDEKAIAEGMIELAGSTGLRDDLRRRGLQRAQAFSWDRTGRETAAVYREVVEETRVRRTGRA